MAWFDDLNLPGATIDGFFGYVTADGPDEDDNPDVMLADGTVTFTATTPAARVDGAWLGIQAVTAQIFEGRLIVSEENPFPIRLLATDANIGVADWAWKATFDIRGFTLAPLTFKAPRGTTVNLTADLIPIKSQPYQIIEGASIVDAEVDDAGRMRFEMSDGSFTKWVDIPNGEQGIKGDKGDKGDAGADGTAATLTMGAVSQGSIADAWMTGTATSKQLNLTLPRGAKGDKGADAVQPTIDWDGTTLVFGGKPSPDLKGESGLASVLSPRDGVWMIDQATGQDVEALADLQQAVADRVTRGEFNALEASMESKLDGGDLQAINTAVDAKADTSAVAALASQIASLPTVQSGLVTIQAVKDQVSSATVTFPKPFSKIPNVTVTAVSGVPGTVVEVSASNMTATGFTAYVLRTTTAAMNVMWIAVTE